MNTKLKSLFFALVASSRAQLMMAAVTIILAIPSAWAGSCSQDENALEINELEYIDSTGIIPSLWYFEGEDFLKTPEQDQRSWHRFDEEHIDFGFTHSLLWLCLPIQNTSDQPLRRILNLNSRFMNFIEVDLRGQTTKRVLSESSQTPFSSRPISHRYLAVEIDLEAQQRAELVIRYFSLGSTTLPISLHSEKHYYQNWISTNILTVAFYSVILFLVAFSFFQFLILKNAVQLAYIGYVGSASLYIFHMDGLSFKFLWPTWPELNAAASTYLGLSINFFSIFFARSFLNTKVTNPKLDFIFLCFMFLAAVLVFSATISDSGLIKKLAFIQTTSVLFLCAVAGIIAYVQGQRSARYYIIGWVGITLCAALATASNLISAVFSIPFSFDMSKLGVFFDSLMFALAMADQTSDIRKERDLINKKQTDLLKKELETQQAFSRLENEYKNVLSLAQEKSHLLASAGHDLRQPVVALRAAMQVLVESGKANQQSLDQFKQGFGYIEQLIKQYLTVPDELKESSNLEVSKKSGAEQQVTEVFAIDIILNNIRVMFEQEAKAKGLRFLVRSSSVKVSADPVIVMRLLSNLVVNAVKYTQSGKVLIGCRRAQDHVKVMVLDTGPGISEEYQTEIFEAYERGSTSGESSEGLGLGLSIVTKLAHQADFPFKLVSSSPKGSVFSVTLPIAL
jgi:signal transduction histidine kinase